MIAACATGLAWIAWFGVIMRTNPASIGWEGFALFYATLFAAVGGSATVIGLLTRRQREDHARMARIAVRQGVLVGLGVVLAVLLQSRQLFTWLTMLFLIAALTLLELFVISLGNRRPAVGQP